MSTTVPAPADLGDSYLLYLAALRETGAASVLDAPVTVGTAIVVPRREQTKVPARWSWAFADRQLQP